ncbi:MAG: GIY-YIG nuclease family protein [Proteobacteria bacterium]|nr:GIY-YIG nuclease family protein [Pseudomonadota bacterium]MBI3498473.1 GIY-YIG nuclease family protein [Pseudomonadota bacterium]
MNLNDLLAKQSIDPSLVVVMRHRPFEEELRQILPWLAAEKPRLYNAYQQSRYERQEKALSRARYIVSLIGHEPDRALFVGVYKVGATRTLSRKQFWEIPANLDLRSFGMTGFSENDKRNSTLLFELDQTDVYAKWKGKLVLGWPGGGRTWCRWAERNEFPVEAILDESLLVRAMPIAEELRLSWKELTALPKSWGISLSQWRGIYLIVDASDGKGYVGSAYGADNLHRRWLSYGASGHGGNKRLRERDPYNFRFSILQLLAQDTESEQVLRIESNWKERLHTRKFGLNDN